MTPSATSPGTSSAHPTQRRENRGAIRGFVKSWRNWLTMVTRRRSMNRTVASIGRSPTVVALEGPYQHDNVYVRGVRLHVAVAGSSTDPLILLLHGAFGGWFDYQDVIAPLAARGFHVAAVDLRGYGLSDKPPSGYDLRRSAGDVNGIIGALGHDSAILVGTDTGGSIAWSVSTLYPERVSAVISLGAVHPVDLRRAILRRPHLFGATISRALVFSLPVALLRPVRVLVPRAARKEVVTHTTPPYQRSRAFAEAVKLRQKALSIDHTFSAIIRTNRVLTAALPARVSHQLAHCPIWLIRPRDKRTDHLVALARTRTTGTFTVATIPGITDLSFLEDPEQFTGMVADFAQTL